MLLSCMPDLHNVTLELKQCMQGDDMLELYNDNAVHLYTLTPAMGALPSKWHAVCSGRYKLDLGMQVS